MVPDATPEPVARTDLPAGEVTFVFTDIEGSTKLLHDIGPSHYAAALAEHRRIIRAVVREHGGVEVDNQGDAFFLAFASAAAAVDAAAAMTAGLTVGTIRVRIGVHTGAPHLTDEGYVGDDVHLAARIAATAHGGQVVVSAATAARVGPEVVLRDLGEHRLKDFAGAVVIHQLGEATFPPLRSLGATNLPTPISRFLGRAEEVETIRTELASARLVTLTGPGGTGKTRLAIEAAGGLGDRFPAGIHWVGCATIREPEFVVAAIGEALGTPDDLANVIAGRRMLLVLDNLEQVVAVGPALGSLVVACPGLRILATSRERLAIGGEVEHAVPSLAEAEAVELFCERSGLTPTPEIAVLCRRLDHLPLAVELAAARTKALSPAQILDRLDRRLDLLKGARDVDGRQGTLRSTIDWSHDLLDEEERRLFRGLSVFPGGCRLELAELVLDADLDVLESLVAKSLVRFSRDRCWMLETIRAYALERLADDPDRERREQAFAAWAVDLVEALDALLRGPRQLAALEGLDAEVDNIRGAMAILLAAGDGDSARRLACGAAWWMARRGRRVELLGWLRSALAAPGGDPQLRVKALLSLAHGLRIETDRAELAAIGRQGVGLATAIGDPALEAGFLEILAFVASGDDGLELLDRAGALFAAADRTDGVIRVALNRGAIAVNVERYVLAIEALTDVLRRIEPTGNRHGIGITLMNLAIARLMTGDIDGGSAAAARAVDELESVGDLVGQTVLLAVLALAEARRGSVELAAVLVAASDTNLAVLGEDLEASDRKIRSLVDAALSSLPVEQRAARAAEGAALSIDAAVERWRRHRAPG